MRRSSTPGKFPECASVTAVLPFYRTLIRMRVTKPRREFADENFSFTEKDAGDATNDLKQNQKQGQTFFVERKQLDIGLQAANKMVNLQTQTYFNRSVNAMCQYQPNDFIKEI